MDDTEILMAHWRSETIEWGNIAVALMNKLEGLSMEEKFCHLAVEEIVKKLADETEPVGQVPKETKEIIERGDQVEMSTEAKKALTNFRKCNDNYNAFKNQIKFRATAS